jgi:hypothetical protein
VKAVSVEWAYDPKQNMNSPDFYERVVREAARRFKFTLTDSKTQAHAAPPAGQAHKTSARPKPETRPIAPFAQGNASTHSTSSQAEDVNKLIESIPADLYGFA